MSVRRYLEWKEEVFRAKRARHDERDGVGNTSLIEPIPLLQANETLLAKNERTSLMASTPKSCTAMRVSQKHEGIVDIPTSPPQTNPLSCPASPPQQMQIPARSHTSPPLFSQLPSRPSKASSRPSQKVTTSSTEAAACQPIGSSYSTAKDSKEKIVSPNDPIQSNGPTPLPPDFPTTDWFRELNPVLEKFAPAFIDEGYENVGILVYLSEADFQSAMVSAGARPGHIQCAFAGFVKLKASASLMTV